MKVTSENSKVSFLSVITFSWQKRCGLKQQPVQLTCENEAWNADQIFIWVAETTAAGFVHHELFAAEAARPEPELRPWTS